MYVFPMVILMLWVIVIVSGVVSDRMNAKHRRPPEWISIALSRNLGRVCRTATLLWVALMLLAQVRLNNAESRMRAEAWGMFRCHGRPCYVEQNTRVIEADSEARSAAALVNLLWVL